jgi:predicted solute-binding protein
LFPDFASKDQDLLVLIKLRRYLLLECSIYLQDEITEDDKLFLRTEKNAITIKERAKKIDLTGIDIERYYSELISYLDLDENATVIRFYSKLDFLNKKNKKELEDARQ